MQRITEGSTVSLEFTGYLSNGTLFGEASPENPLRFTVGRHEMLDGVEEAVVGMAPGESKTTVIPPEKGFGRRSKERVLNVDRAQMPAAFDAERDRRVQLSTRDGNAVSARVVKADEREAVLDANHPLAGETLTLNLRVLDAEPPETNAPPSTR